MNPALREALAAAAPDLERHCRDPWTVIGSAAAALAGAEVSVADLDVLTSVRDAEVLIALWHDRRDAAYLPVTGADRFRSRFARFRFPGLPLELMGGLELHGPQGWQPVRVRATVRADCGGIAVPIPAPAEQVRILQGFARPKDLQRAALLAAVHSPDR